MSAPVERATPTPTPKVTGIRRVPALDGYRGLAVAAVVLFHADVVRGGWLGVDLFFVLSGFLITRLIVHERAGTGGVDMAEFWRRRGRRLLPALVVFFVGIACYVLWYPDTQLLPPDLPGEMFATTFYVANWFQLSTSSGYWDQYAVASPLKHMWSLSIEEQFYVLFPVAMVGLFLALRRRHHIAWTLGVLTVASWSLGFFLLATGSTFERVYLGTDTRVGAVLCGATVGFLSCNPSVAPVLERWARRLSIPALVVVVLGMLSVDGSTGWSAIRWSILPIFEISVCIVLLAALEESRTPGFTTKLATLRPLMWLGAISYGLYLWHFPILLAAERQFATSPRWLVVTIAVAASLAAAVLSYRLVEQPIRHGGLAIAPRYVLGGLAVVVTAASLAVVYFGTAEARDYRAEREPSAEPGTGPDRMGDDLVAVDPGDPPVAPIEPVGPVSLPLARPVDRNPRVLLLGDSLAWDMVGAFRSTAAERDVDGSVSASIGCAVGGMDVVEDGSDPYNTPEMAAACDDWIRSWPELLDTTRPDVVVLLRAANRPKLPGSEEFADPCSPEYLDFYRTGLQQEIDVLAASGATVAVASMPYNRFAARIDEDRDRGLNCLNEVLHDVVDANESAVVLPVAEWVCPTATSCLGTVGDDVVLRPDGVHFQDEGAEYATDWIVDELYGRGS